jgi:hypothetical protein
MGQHHLQGRGGDECINGWYEGKSGTSLYEHRASVLSLQLDLYTCAKCGSWWIVPALGLPAVVSAADAQEMIDGTWKP